MNSVDELPKTTFSGRRFTRRQLARVQETVSLFPKLSRKELAQTICEHLDWRNPRGANRTGSCLNLLEKLEALGLITLPEKRDADVAPKHLIDLAKAEREEPIAATLAKLSPIVLTKVVNTEERAAFRASIQAHHYLGYRQPIGNHIGYFIVSQPQAQRLGCLVYSASSSWNLPARDQWIAWDKKYRQKLLHLVLTQQRFLIFPWVNVPHLASHVLAISEEQVASDWVKTYGYRPVLLETFVDPTRFSGTCYKAANWQHIGQTQGRGRRQRDTTPGQPGANENPKTVTAKDVFVRPLARNFRSALTEGHQARAVKKRYRNDVNASRTEHVDETFIELWKRVLHLIRKVAVEYDRQWRIRDRLIDTLLLMLLIFRLVTAKNKQGYGTTIDELWDSCHEADLPLPQKESIAPSSLCAARKKLDENVFKCLNARVLDTYSQQHGEEYPWLGRRVFAVDGSKIQLPRSLIRSGYALPGDGSNYPQGLLSCLYELRSQVPVDFDLAAHGDERRCAEEHLHALKAGDVVVYDRGYFSYVMLHHHAEAGIHAVFRLPESSASAINTFMASTETDATVTIYPSKPTLAQIARTHPGLQIVPRTMRLVKYQINNIWYCLGTTLVEPAHEVPLQSLMELYYSRWGIEELYKVSKRVFAVEDFHSKYERGVKQELFAHFVLITVNRIFANRADSEINAGHATDEAPPPRPTTTKSTAVNLQLIKVNFKNCIHVIARRLETLVLVHKKLVAAVKAAYAFIVKRHQRVRPGRSYPRKSLHPESKWHATKKKNRQQKLAPVALAPALSTDPVMSPT